MIFVFCWFFCSIEDEDDAYDENLQAFQDADELVCKAISDVSLEKLKSCLLVF